VLTVSSLFPSELGRVPHRAFNSLETGDGLIVVLLTKQQYRDKYVLTFMLSMYHDYYGCGLEYFSDFLRCKIVRR
jgi:hypothetical protein